MSRYSISKICFNSFAVMFVFFCIAFFATGCSYFIKEKQFETFSVPEERLYQIEVLDLESMLVESEPADANAVTKEVPAEQNIAIEECRTLALKNNLTLKVQLFNPPIAQENVNIARAAFEPLAFSQLSFTKTDTPTSLALDASKSEMTNVDVGVQIPLLTGGTITIDQPFSRVETNNIFATLNPSYTTDLLFSIRHPLLRGAGIETNTHEIRIAGYESQISQARTKLEVISVLATVDIVYWRLYATRRELEVRKQEYDLAVSQRDQAQRKVDAGQVSEIEVIRAEARVAERLEAIIQAENLVRDRQRDLKRIINKPNLQLESPTILIPTTEPNPIRYKLDTELMLQYALEQRMELLELQLQIAKDASTIDFERNNTLPLLALDYTYNINGLGSSGNDSYDLMLENRFVDHRLGLVLQVPLGNEAAKARLQRAILSRQQALASRLNRETEIKKQVLNAIDELEANWQRVLASRQSTILAARTLQAEQRQFEQGLQTSTEVLDAQTRFADAQSAQIRALVEYQIAQVDLAFATGSLLEAARVHWEPSTK